MADVAVQIRLRRDNSSTKSFEIHLSRAPSFDLIKI
jgi:hypothetical protein